MLRVDSTDGVVLAVHDLGGDAGLPPLLISHATGFHGRAYQPLADALADRFHVLAVDHRGHGATAAPDSWADGSGVDWSRFGDDTLAVARAIAPDGGLVAFGHSMGGASLLMAAHRDPDAFGRLVLFEPIAGDFRDSAWLDPDMIPLVAGARRRRRRFGSYDEAYENFRRKPPLSLMTPESLRQYVDHGFRPVATGDGDGVELCCPPEIESTIFARARLNGVWELLPQVSVPTLVISGAIQPDQPSAFAEQVAERLPHGSFIELPDQTHFGPFSHPRDVAALIDPE